MSAWHSVKMRNFAYTNQGTYKYCFAKCLLKWHKTQDRTVVWHSYWDVVGFCFGWNKYLMYKSIVSLCAGKSVGGNGLKFHSIRNYYWSHKKNVISQLLLIIVEWFRWLQNAKWTRGSNLDGCGWINKFISAIGLVCVLWVRCCVFCIYRMA